MPVGPWGPGSFTAQASPAASVAGAASGSLGWAGQAETPLGSRADPFEQAHPSSGAWSAFDEEQVEQPALPGGAPGPCGSVPLVDYGCAYL